MDSLLSRTVLSGNVSIAWVGMEREVHCWKLSLAVDGKDKTIEELTDDKKFLVLSSMNLQSQNDDLADSISKLKTSLNSTGSEYRQILGAVGNKLQDNTLALQRLSAQNTDLSQQLQTAKTPTYDPYAIPQFAPNPILDNYLNSNPYHDITIITPTGITNATVIDNN
jgi:hypothetical protein